MIKTVNIHEKQWGDVWGRDEEENHLPLSMDIPFPSDSVPLSLSNCLSLRRSRWLNIDTLAWVFNPRDWDLYSNYPIF